MTKTMKYSFILIGAILLAQCSPKTASVAIDSGTTEAIVDHSFRQSAPEAGPAPKINIGKAETFKLDNGLTVLTLDRVKCVQFAPLVLTSCSRLVDAIGVDTRPACA